MLSKRVVELDYLKGAAIALVVLGHGIAVVNMGVNYSSLTFLFDYIYIFHMPMFFLISGILFYTDISLLKKANILIPYFVIGLPHSIEHLISCFWSESIVKNILLEIFNLFFRGGYYWYLIFLFYMMALTKILSYWGGIELK